MTSFRRFVAASTFVSFVASSGAAFAQTYAPPPPGAVPLRLESDTAHTQYKVYAGKHAKVPWFECLAPCTYSVPKGEYRIEARGDEMANGDGVADVTGDTRVVTHGGSSGGKTTGLVLGIVGSASVAVGLLGAFAVSMECLDSCSKAEQDKHATEADAFLVVAGVGALVSLAGWLMFASNRTHVEAEPTYAPRIVSIGVGPTSGGGASLGAFGTF